jgi:VIT1/CCC1 family predicted Fe2+/Mn2+ transporter
MNFYICYNELMAEFDKEKYDLPSDQAGNSRLNQLRAAVLGANDGIVSVSSVVMGVAGATSDHRAITMSGLAALVAGALSMAVGEYVSVSSQSDAEKAFIRQEIKDLDEDPAGELDELAREYMKQGVSEPTARKVAEELTEKDPLRAHLAVHFNLDPDDINNPWQAAIASLVAFTVGGLVPFLTVVFTPIEYRIGASVVAVIIALVATGYFSAVAGNASHLRAVTRVVIGGVLAMVLTYFVGVLFGTTIH